MKLGEMEDGHGGHMAIDANLLQGEVSQDPESEEKDIQQLLLGFLRALIEEQAGK